LHFKHGGNAAHDLNRLVKTMVSSIILILRNTRLRNDL